MTEARTIRGAWPIDLGLTLGAQQRGPTDPTFVFAPSGLWRALRTPEGPATLRFVARGEGVLARAWGPGATWALAMAPKIAGAEDSLDGFAPTGLVKELHRRLPGLRMSNGGRVFDALVPTILEQKVAGKEAFLSYASIVKRWGEPAPRPPGAPRLVVPPAPDVLAKLAYWELHEHGVERRRAETIRYCASRARRVEEAAEMDTPTAQKRLEALRGVGPWTANEVLLRALGHADAVPIGDYHLPHMVSWALLGEARGTDARMLELLAPFAPHRGRVLRLMVAAGLGPPRRGPRRPLRRIAAL
jgi:3-methyladenine DNA glycosylase/8-oxoguanine DNA glycosylase